MRLTTEENRSAKERLIPSDENTDDRNPDLDALDFESRLRAEGNHP
jgi:hypothetical protein